MEILTAFSRSEFETLITETVTKCLNQKTRIEKVEQPDEIDIAEAEIVTGLKRSTLYKGSWDGSVPCKKRGKKLIFSRKELSDWLESRTVAKKSLYHIASEELRESVSKKAM